MPFITHINLILQLFNLTMLLTAKSSSNSLNTTDPKDENDFNLYRPSYGLSEQCAQDLLYLQDIGAKKYKSYGATSSKWQKHMMDANGQLSSGLHEYNHVFLGDFTQCQLINVWKDTITKVEDKKPDFVGKYCLADCDYTFQNPVPEIQSRNVGVCIPSTCSGTEMESVIRNTITTFRCKIRETTCQIKEPVAWDLTSVIISILFGCLGFMVLTGTLYETYHKFLKWKRRDNFNLKCHHKDKLICNTGNVLLAFSAINNTKKLLNTSEQGDGILSCINGLRAITMSWVVIGHVMVETHSDMYWKNFRERRYSDRKFFYQIVTSAEFSVDTFLCISGFFLVYVFMKDMNRRNGKWNIFTFYVHRIWRTLPTYAVIVGLMSGPFYLLGNGPVWNDGKEYDIHQCRTSWWRYLLYINVYFHEDDKCLPQTWYLCLDMLYYIASPLLLCPLYRKPAVGIFLCGICFASAIAISAYLIYNHELASLVTPFILTGNRILFAIQVYYAPWCRMHAFIAGMLFAYLYHEKSNIRMNKIFVAITWVVVSAVMLALVFGTYEYTSGKKYMSNAMQAAHGSLTRPTWALCIGWIIFACATGYGGVINTILSWKGFIPFSRLSYAAYLSHISIISYFYATRNDTLYIDLYFMSFVIITLFTVSIFAAWILNITIEGPTMALEKIFDWHKQSQIKDPSVNPNFIPKHARWDRNLEGSDCELFYDTKENQN